jgi:hypothetical protein
MATDWNTYKPTVLKQESGGDYNALYNFAQKPGRIFAGVQPTQMTINDLLKFANPSGAYGQYVKETRPDKQFGVATPLGAYGVVGSTLRDAVKGLGLTGDELFDQATQDKVAEWLYNNRGASTWAASNKKPVGDIMAFQPTQIPAAQAAQPQARQPGLLSAFGLQKRDPAATGETAQPFYQRNNFKDFMGNLAIGLNSMRLEPDQNIAAVVQGQQKTRKEGGDKNRTIAWLRSLGTPEAIKAASALEMGAIDASTAVSASGFGGKNYTVMNGAEVAQKYNVQADGAGTAIDPNALYNVSSSGQITKVGSANTIINAGDTDSFVQAGQKKLAEQFNTLSEVGMAARSALGQTQMLDALLTEAGTGFGTGLTQFAKDVFGVDVRGDAAAAANAIISQLVPAQRPAGSGTMSDADLALYKNSLPSIAGRPGGNRIIIESMKSIANYNVQIGQLADRALTDASFTPAMAKAAMNELPNPLAGALEYMRVNGIGGDNPENVPPPNEPVPVWNPQTRSWETPG